MTTQQSLPFGDKVPGEILLKILGYILVYPEPLAFTCLPLSDLEDAIEVMTHDDPWQRRQYSRILRLCILEKCAIDEPESQALMSDFSSLCLVSKFTRLVSREMFFSKNHWVLHATTRFNAITWVLDHWGQEALRAMTHVKIELQNTERICRLAFKSLDRFVEEVKDGHNLQHLTVRWMTSSRPTSSAINSERIPHMEKLLGPPLCNVRTSDGGRTWNVRAGKPHPILLKRVTEAWKDRELVLLPLKHLRNIRFACIEGTVRESWAVHLEKVMMASSDEIVPSFDYSPKDALLQLRNSPAFDNPRDYDGWTFSRAR